MTCRQAFTSRASEETLPCGIPGSASNTQTQSSEVRQYLHRGASQTGIQSRLQRCSQGHLGMLLRVQAHVRAIRCPLQQRIYLLQLLA